MSEQQQSPLSANAFAFGYMIMGVILLLPFMVLLNLVSLVGFFNNKKLKV